MIRTSGKALLLLALLLLPAGLYSQEIVTNLGPASNFNLYALNNVNLSSSDVEGRVAVSGSATFTSFDIGDKITFLGENTLVVGDSLFYNGGSVYNGNAVYGNYESTSNFFVPQGELKQGNPVDFITGNLKLADISRLWKAIPGYGQTGFSNNELTLNGTDAELNIFQVDGEELSQANNIVITAPAGATVLVNVSGVDVSVSGGMVLTGVNKTKVVFNFYEAANLNVQNISFLGSILAPFANLNFPSGLIEGNVVVYSAKGAGQYNLSPFQGTIEYIPSQLESECVVTIKNTDKGTNVNLSENFNGTKRYWAGTFQGYINNHAVQFYCVDIGHNLVYNKDYYMDIIVSGPIKYIVHNYFPNKPFTGNNGQINNVNKEAAAIQAAIWHYSDGFPHESITDNAIRQRAMAIVAEAEGKNPLQLSSLELMPKSQLVQSDAAAEFTVMARDTDGNPAPGIELVISAGAGTLSAEEGITDAAGEFRFTLLPGGEDQIQVEVMTYDAVIPGGTRYIRPGNQTIVTNMPANTCLTTTAVATWTDDPLPGNTLDFYAYNMSNSTLPGDYFTCVDVCGDFAAASVKSAGFVLFYPNELVKHFDMQNSTLHTNEINCVRIVDFNAQKNDIAFGLETMGLAYRNNSTGQIKTYNSSNGFADVSVYDIEQMTFNGENYLAIAHSGGLSFMKLSDKSFVHSPAITGLVNAVTMDGTGVVWAATNTGLVSTTDLGTTATVYDTSNSTILSNFVTAVTADGDNIFVGFYNQGLAVLNKTNGVWGVMTPFISTNPVDDLLFADGKLFIANYNRGLYVFDGENFEQYYTVTRTPVTTIVEALAYHDGDLWAATRSGLSKTMHGINPQFGNAAITLEDRSTHVGGTTTMAVKIVPDGELSISSFTGTIVYNTNELQLVGGTPGALLNGWNLYDIGSEEGMLHYRGTGNSPVTSEGVLFYLTFKVKNEVPAGGHSAVYVTSFNADLDTPLEHTDLGIIYYSETPAGNGGKGDANLDGRIDVADIHAVANHMSFQEGWPDYEPYELTGDALANADADENGSIEYNDISTISQFITNGMFAPVPDNSGAPQGMFYSDFPAVYNTERQVELWMDMSPVGRSTEGKFRNVYILLSYDPELFEYETFASSMLGSGNFVKAEKVGEGKAKFTFAAPFEINASNRLGSVILTYPENANPLGKTISVSYSVDGSELIQGQDIVIRSMDVEEETLPQSFVLYNNYPNPFNPTTNIRYALPEAANVKIVVYDLLGQEVTTLVNSEIKPGLHTIKWNSLNETGMRVSSGVYFFRIEASPVNGGEKFISTQKMLLLK